ncbi:MAG: hypothetical protein ABI222_06455 [Opitutaceae bacterium]
MRFRSSSATRSLTRCAFFRALAPASACATGDATANTSWLAQPEACESLSAELAE